MKKIITTISMIIFYLFVMCGCGKSMKTEELSKDIDVYQKIAETALKDFQDEEHYSDTYGERYVIYLSEFDKYDDLASFVDLADDNFSYLWIEDGNVVFWDNETKVLGLVYSQNPKEYIKVLGKWYNDIESEKINENCYTVGQWRHR